MRGKHLGAICAVVACVLVVVFVPSSGAAPAPIKIGGIVSKTGPVPFVDWAEGATAYFDRLNKHGGINGHKVQLTLTDDKGDPTQTASLARKFVADGIVAFVASLSLNDCGVNRNYYIQQKIVAISIGGEVPCFKTPNIAPVNQGPQYSAEGTLLYARNVLHKKKVCFLGLDNPGMNGTIAAAVKSYTAITGEKPTLTILKYGMTADMTPAILKFKNAGCQALAFTGILDAGIAIRKAADQQGAKMVFLSGVSIADPGYVKALGPKLAEGSYSLTEFKPLGTPGTEQMTADFKAAGLTPKATLMTGWTAADAFTKVVKTIKGPITREAVTKAFKSMKKGINVPSMGNPFIFGNGSYHVPNHTGYANVFKNGEWRFTGRKVPIDPSK